MLIASIEIANRHILEEDGCILSDSLIRCDQRHIRIHRRCLFIVVSGSHLRNVFDIVAVPVSDQTDLGMHLITFKSVNHTASCFFQTFGPVNIVLLIESGSQLDQNRNLFAVLGRRT